MKRDLGFCDEEGADHLAGTCFGWFVPLLLPLLVPSQVSQLSLLPTQSTLVLRLQGAHPNFQLIALLLQLLVLLLQQVFGRWVESIHL